MTEDRSPSNGPEVVNASAVATSLLEHIGLFLRRHFDLLVADARETLRRVAMALALFAASLVLGGVALALVMVTLVLALGRILPAWAASLVVMGASVLIALVVALIGRGLLKRGIFPRTVDTLREDRRWLNEQFRSRRR